MDPKFPLTRTLVDAGNKVLPPSHFVQFLFVVGLRNEMVQMRDDAHCFYGNSKAIEWTPYAPEFSEPIGLLAQRASGMHDLMFEEIQFDGNCLQAIEKSEKDLTVTVIIVDPWTAQLSKYKDFLERFDRYQFINCAVLIPWNLADQRTKEKYDELKAKVEETLQRKFRFRNNSYLKDSIQKYSELQDIVRETVRELNDGLANLRKPRRILGTGTFAQKPAVSASGDLLK